MHGGAVWFVLRSGVVGFVLSEEVEALFHLFAGTGFGSDWRQVEDKLIKRQQERPECFSCKKVSLECDRCRGRGIWIWLVGFNFFCPFQCVSMCFVELGFGFTS